MVYTSTLSDDILNRFVEKLKKKDVSVKDNKAMQGRKVFDLQYEAEEFLDTLGVNLAMSYELVKKAKEKLQELATKKHIGHDSLYIPEVSMHITKGGSVSYWIKRSSEAELYVLLDHDLKNPTLLHKAITLLCSQETKDKLAQELERVNMTREEDKKIRPEQIIGKWLEHDTHSEKSLLKSQPVTFTTNKNTPARIYINLNSIPKEPKDTPAWDSLVNRLTIEGTNLKAKDYFMAFIWSIFEESDRNRVFLYWYDNGKQGKSVAINSLKNKLGEAFDTFDFLNASNHSTESIVNKRLIVQHEGVIKKLTASQLVKQITGGDDIRINPKGRTEYSIKVDAKILVVSNEPPIVSAQLSELSRLLPIKLETRQESDFIDDFEYKINQELDDFLSKCRIVYNKLKTENKEATFLSIENHLIDNDNFKDAITSFIDTLSNRYELRPSIFGSKWKTIQAIINKLIEEDDSFKSKVNSATPKLLDFLSKWAKNHGGRFIRNGANKGLEGVQLVKKEAESLPSNLGDL